MVAPIPPLLKYSIVHSFLKFFTDFDQTYQNLLFIKFFLFKLNTLYFALPFKLLFSGKKLEKGCLLNSTLNLQEFIGKWFWTKALFHFFDAELIDVSRETSMSKLFLLFSEKKVSSKRKEFASLGSKFFHFRVGPFSKGTWYVEKQTVTKIVSRAFKQASYYWIHCKTE